MCVCLFWCSRISSSRASHVPHFTRIRFLNGSDVVPGNGLRVVCSELFSKLIALLDLTAISLDSAENLSLSSFLLIGDRVLGT